ncbi:head-tail connector protein [Prescottella equi]|uniref:head-tail connector protein n=1 Tax=Rhodococcus hoagii TaxID=43767 RepID=UPI000A106CC9|nr:head-tail connector protein [Prescottella equi]ORM00689.1 hypothetical protein A5N69_07035 [Prescottella equi]ORM21571.1 hypothetical protein A5N74_01665 [Prescottella equi]
MALGDPYISLADLKAYLSIPQDETSYDERLNDALNSASREVEQFTGRQFNKATSATPRRFAADGYYSVTVDDFWDEQSLVVEVDGYVRTDITAYPLDGVVDGVPGWPRYRLEVAEGRFLTGRRATLVTVTAKWGWEAVPSTVRQAVLQLSGETFKLAEAPFGVAGSDQFGGVVRVRDLPMVARKLNRFVTTPVLMG